MDSFLLKSLLLSEPAHPLHQKRVDIRIKNGVIIEINEVLEATTTESVIDLNGYFVSGGWFDPEVALSEPGFESKGRLMDDLNTIAESGCTHIGLLPNFDPVPDKGSVVSYFSQFNSHPTRIINYGTLSKASNGEDLAELYDLSQSGTSVFYDYKKDILNTSLMKLALQYTQPFKGVVGVFACDGYLKGKGVALEGVTSTRLGLKAIPAIAESIRIQRDLELLRYTGGKLHFLNISTPESVSLIRNAKSEGLNVTASVSIAQLYFNDTALEEFEGRYKLLPPLSNKTTQKVLLDALLEGTIDFIGSDHYNCSTEEKNVEFDLADFGSRSNEHLFAALTELVGFCTACELLQRPYTFFGLEKPTLAQGSVATLSFFRKEPYRVTEKEPQTELFFGQQFDYKAQGIFSNGKLHLKTTH